MIRLGSPHPLVAVVGEGILSHPDHGALAEEVGRRLAEAGCGVVCGGLGGVMEAACRGARNAGGLTVGLLPGTDIREANPYVHVAIATGAGQMRNVMLVLSAQAVIAIGGGAGTLSEIGHALRAGRRVVGLRTWQAAVGGRPADVLEARTAEEAVRLALTAEPRAAPLQP